MEEKRLDRRKVWKNIEEKRVDGGGGPGRAREERDRLLKKFFKSCISIDLPGSALAGSLGNSLEGGVTLGQVKTSCKTCCNEVLE